MKVEIKGIETAPTAPTRIENIPHILIYYSLLIHIPPNSLVKSRKLVDNSIHLQTSGQSVINQNHCKNELFS